MWYVAWADKVSFAKDSAIRMMASNWRTVIGMVVDSEASIFCACPRISM